VDEWTGAAPQGLARGPSPHKQKRRLLSRCCCVGFPKLRYNSPMRRWLCIATFSLVLLTLPVWAQRHGSGGGGAHFAAPGFYAAHSFGHSSAGYSSGGHPSIGRSSAGRPAAAFRGGSFARSSGVRVRIGNRYSRGFYGRRGYYPYAGYYPYYGWYTDPLFDADDQDSYSGEYSPAPVPYRDDSRTQRDLDQLNGKVDRLQQSVEARNRPKLDPEPATALVFRDQHVEEVHNYAISGGTIWVLNDQAGKKIPLAQLDIPATVKINDDRGVDFQVPGPSLQIMIMN